MSGGREPCHVDADLADDGLGHPLVDPRGAGQAVPVFSERGHHPVDLDRQPTDGLVEIVQQRQDLAD